MKTQIAPTKKMVTAFLLVRLAFVIGIVMFTFSVGKSQSITTTNQPVTVEKMGAHAPDINDPNLAAKKQEWMKSNPDEYKAYLTKIYGEGWDAKVSQNNGQTNTTVTRKMSEHAPDVDDPDYISKFAEFMKNYPEEYKAGMNMNSGSKNK